MEKFIDYFYDEDTYNIPLHADLISVNENGEIEIGIPLKYLPELVKHDVIRLSLDGKTFKTLDEAYQAYDNLSEAKKEDKRTKTKVTDPETLEVRDFEVGIGNAKIGGNTVLLNMSTAGNCMSAILGTCKLGPNGQCYALRFEKQWPVALGKNIRHEKQWACLTPLGIAQGLKKISKAMPKVKYIRVNEAGEFRNLPGDPALMAKVSDEKKAELADVDDVGKLKQVGAELKNLGSTLILYSYTHRSDLDVGDLGENISMNGSGYMLDNAFIPLELDEFNKVMDLAETKQLKEFNGIPVRSAVRCIGDCRVCKYCKEKAGRHIFLPIHGHGTEVSKKIKSIVTAVIENPEFVELLKVNMKPKEAGERAIHLVPQELHKMFVRLVPYRQDRVNLFVDIIKSKGQQEALIAAIEKYVSIGHGGNIEIPISDSDSSEGLARSIDALTGKFKENLERAKVEGQDASQEKWGALIKSLNNVIEKAKSGKEIKVPADLAAQHAGVFGRIKKGMGL